MKTPARFLVILHAVAFIAQVPVGAQDSDPRKVFQSLEPSVVLISDAEGNGSGIVLTEDGLILTNFHVANTPLPQAVEALVEEKGHQVKKSFSKVTMTKVHAQNDLALLKVDTEGFKFKPAKVSKSERDTVAGGTCFAIGYPYVPGQDKPVLTITKGIISAARRMVGNNTYIQLDAAINPGNSGGALVNDKGVVIGIPTLKFEGADRIGLAAPLAGLKMEQFVNPGEKAGDAKEAQRLSNMALDLMFRDAMSFGLDPDVVALAAYLQREAIALEPSNAQWSINIAAMYFRLEKYPLSLAYAENALRLDSKSVPARMRLAECQDKLKMPKEAMANRLACLSIPLKEQDRGPLKEVISKLADAYSAENDAVRSIYLMSWSREVATKDEPTSAAQRLLLQKAARLIPQVMIDEIMAKKAGHSVADMDSYAARARTLPAAAPNEAPVPADISKIQPQFATGRRVTSEVHFKSGATAKLMDAPPGVVFDDEKGTLEWTPQPFSKKDQVEVLFLLTNADGSEETLVHPISRK